MSSFFKELAHVHTEHFQATRLIQFLVETVSRDVCTAKRNTMSLYQAINRARDLCNQINALIEQVDKDNGDCDWDLKKESWDSFQKYTAAITPLESFVLHTVVHTHCPFS